MKVSFLSRMTLIELLVVLFILIALGGIALSLFMDIQNVKIGSEQKTIPETITNTTLQTLFKAIMGEGQTSGYFADLGQTSAYFPQTLADLFRVPSYLPSELQTFRPSLRLGWRGPYLAYPTARYGIESGSTFVFRIGFGADYGQPEDPTLLDAWGKPIVLQTELDEVLGTSDLDARYARLVSAGQNGILETPTGSDNIIPGNDPLTELTLSECGDDLVLFLQVPDTRE